MGEENYNQDELVPPNFLNEEYIMNILKTVEDDPELHLISYEIKPGSAAGDHYASIMFKIIASYGTRGRIVTQRRFILKTVPEAEGQKKEFLDNSPAFKNEIVVYTKVLVAMEAILKENGEKGWWPKLVFSTTQPFVLVFDDLSVENYQVVHDPLDFKAVSLIVEKLAKYHAMGLILLERGMEEILRFEPGINDSAEDMMKPMEAHMANLAREVKTWPGFEEIGNALLNYSSGSTKGFLAFLKRDNTGGFNVLNHGDFHIRNLMFKKSDNGDVSDVIFLDFQMPIYNSPSFDLVGLLNTICNKDVRKRREEVLKLYRDTLAASMKLYGYQGRIPSGIDIQIEMLKCTEYDAGYALLTTPIFSIKGIEMAEMFRADEDSKVVQELRKIYRDPEFIEEKKPLLYTYYNRGIFD